MAKMMQQLALVVTLGALGMALAAPASMTAAQQAAWNIAEQYADYQFAGQFTTMCEATMTPNPTFVLEWNPAFVPWGGNWVGAAGSTGCTALGTGFAEAWSNYADWAIVTHMVLHAVNADGTAVFGTLTLDSTSKATGNKLTNITIGHQLNIGTYNGTALVKGLGLHADSAAMAQSLCSSNKMKCASFGGSSSAPTMTAAKAQSTPVDLKTLTPPKLAGVKGLAIDTAMSSVDMHSLAVLMASKQVSSYAYTEATNMQNLQAYWNSIFAGNFAGAEGYLSETVTLSWAGQFEWVPVAGTFVGKNGWASFFAAASTNTRNFTFTEFTYQGCNNNTCAMTWDEHSIVLANDRAIDGLLNWVIYYFTSDNLIQHIEVLVDSMSYGAAFCDGFVVCDDN